MEQTAAQIEGSGLLKERNREKKARRKWTEWAKKEAESEIRVITARPAVSGNSSLCWNEPESGGGERKGHREGKREAKATDSIQQKYKSISIKLRHYKIKVEERRSRWGQQGVDSTVSERPVKVGQWRLQAFCLKTFRPLPPFLSLSLTLILTVAPTINSRQRPQWPELDCDAFKGNWAELSCTFWETISLKVSWHLDEFRPCPQMHI